MADLTIQDWTVSQLLRFIKQQIDEHEKVASPSQMWDEVEVTQKLKINDQLQFGVSQTTVGAAGAASALPATPDAYIKVIGPDGVVRLLPLYKS